MSRVTTRVRSLNSFSSKVFFFSVDHSMLLNCRICLFSLSLSLLFIDYYLHIDLILYALFVCPRPLFFLLFTSFFPYSCFSFFIIKQFTNISKYNFTFYLLQERIRFLFKRNHFEKVHFSLKS